MNLLRSYFKCTSVDHFQSSKLEYNTLQHGFFTIDNMYVLMYCMFPHSNFDDWKWSTDKRCIRNEIISF